MSKSEWKEFPDYRQVEEYGFMENATLETWAWEVLRRNDDYRSDWQSRGEIAKMTHYHPPLAKAETKDEWMRRMSITPALDPITMREDLYRAQKWGVEELYDPEQPFSPSMHFIKPWSDFPRFIFLPENFYALVEDDETEERLIERVGDAHAVIGFHLERPLGDQLKDAEAMLRSWKEQLKMAGKIKTSGHAGKKDKWLRHLRVLDALRLNPPASYAEIALALGGIKNKGAPLPDLNRDGDKLVTAARRMERGGYRNMLLFKGS